MGLHTIPVLLAIIINHVGLGGGGRWGGPRSYGQLTSRRLSPARHMIRSLPFLLMALAEHSAAWMDVKSNRNTSSAL